MIYNPKEKGRSYTYLPSSEGGFSVAISGLDNLANARTSDPSAFAESLLHTKPVWVTKPFSGLEKIIYTSPNGSISRQIKDICSQLDAHINARREAYRRRKNEAMKQIRLQCEVSVPVFKYVRTWQVRDITYQKRVKLRVADAMYYIHNSTTLVVGTVEYKRLQAAKLAIGPFDRTRTVQLTFHKTIGYWANVKTFVRNRKVIMDRRKYDERRADWVNKNPPYSPSKDPVVSSYRQEIINLKLKLSTTYNQCVAYKTAGRCGSPSECWEAAWSMCSQYMLPSTILPVGRYFAFKSEGVDTADGNQLGYCVRVEEYSWGDNDHAPGWVPTHDYLDEWSSLERSIELTDEHSNTDVGKKVNPYASSALELIGERDFAYGDLPYSLTFRASYDRAALNLQAGGGNPFEWNFARSVAELKDTKQTVRTAKDFLRSISAGKLKGVYTVGQAATLYLTYKFGIAPTAAELGTLLGASRSLLKHTYPMLRTLNAYAQGAATASITGRSRVTFDESSFVNSIFPSTWQQDLRLGTIYAHNMRAKDGSWRVSTAASEYGLYNQEGFWSFGTDKYVSSKVWNQIEREGVAPVWVWLPEDPLVFCKYDAKKLRDTLGTTFTDVLGSLDVITTGWELTPLSFVVDWFTNLKSSFQAMDDFVRADRLDLLPDGEGPWHSTRFRLCLAVPIYRKAGGSRAFTVWYSSLDTREEEWAISGRRFRATYVTPQGASVRIRAPKYGVNVIRSDVTAYARDLMEGAPLLALLPELKVSLNAGKLSSLLAILLSGR